MHGAIIILIQLYTDDHADKEFTTQLQSDTEHNQTVCHCKHL